MLCLVTLSLSLSLTPHTPRQIRAVRAFAADAGPHILLGDFNVFQKADCSDAQWTAIIADADSKVMLALCKCRTPPFIYMTRHPPGPSEECQYQELITLKRRRS